MLGVLDVDVRCAATCGRAPVDAADAVARRQRAKIGELDPLAPLARDLAAQDRPGAERRDDPAQPFDAGVDPHVDRLAQRSVDRRRPEPVARADDRGTDVVHAPAPGRELEPAAHAARRARARTRPASGRCRAARRPAGGRRRARRRRGCRRRASRAADLLRATRSRSSRSSPSSASGSPASATATSSANGVARTASCGRPVTRAASERRRREPRVQAQPR